MVVSTHNKNDDKHNVTLATAAVHFICNYTTFTTWLRVEDLTTAIKAVFVSFIQCATKISSAAKKRPRENIHKTEIPVKGHYQHKTKPKTRGRTLIKWHFKIEFSLVPHSYKHTTHSYMNFETNKKNISFLSRRFIRLEVFLSVRALCSAAHRKTYTHWALISCWTIIFILTAFHTSNL